MPEVSTGMPRTTSPSLNAAIKEHLRGQALTVVKLCERELCETLQMAFLGERKSLIQDSLATGVARNSHGMNSDTRSRTPSPRGASQPLEAYIEILDYVGGNDFHGFVTKNGDERGLFVFFGEELRHKDLKAGIMAILELASTDRMDITQVVACIDRKMPEADLSALTRDLGWVGFEMTTLEPWTDGEFVTSDEWLLLKVEI